MNYDVIEKKITAWIIELKDYRVSLDSDPLAAGLGTFNEKIALAREYANRCASILTTAVFIKREAQATRDLLKSKLDSDLNSLLSNDARVYEVPEGQRSSVETRRANAFRILREDENNGELKVAEAENFLHTASAFQDMARHIYDNINETRKDLLYQISVIRTQIAIGEVHGDPLINKSMFSPEEEASNIDRPTGPVSF